MNLKKNDKIIAVVGVLIIVLAGVSIFLLQVDEEVDDSDGSGNNQYDVVWEQHVGVLKINEEQITEGETYEQSIKIERSGTVITSVEVKVEWEDDHTWGLLKTKKGQDTMTLNIAVDEGACKTHEATGFGNETLTGFFVNEKPAEMSVEANTFEEAEIEALNACQGKDSFVLHVEGTISVGEGFKILQPIRSFVNSMRDNGNPFSLIVSYTYYESKIVEENGEQNTGNQLPESDGETDLSMFYLSSMGRTII